MSRTLFDQYTDLLDGMADEPGTYYEIVPDSESPALSVAVYPDMPDGGHATAFSFGLSSMANPGRKDSRPELIISVNSLDHSWGLAMGEILRRGREECSFSQGTVIRFGERVSDESVMSDFVVFANALFDHDDSFLRLPGRLIHLSQLYPIHVAEVDLIRRIGAERFFKEYEWDPFDIRRGVARLR